MSDVIEELEAWTAAGDRVALATVVRTRRSAPRPQGAKMAMNERGEVAAEVVAVRNGHEGGRPGSAPRRIHEVGDEVSA